MYVHTNLTGLVAGAGGRNNGGAEDAAANVSDGGRRTVPPDRGQRPREALSS